MEVAILGSAGAARRSRGVACKNASDTFSTKPADIWREIKEWSGGDRHVGARMRIHYKQGVD